MASNLARKVVVFTRSDTTPGTPETTFNPALHTMLLFNENNPVQPDTRIVELNPTRASFTKNKQLVGRTLHMFKPTTVLMGSGTLGVAPFFGPLLKSCALNEVIGVAAGSSYVAYVPISTGIVSSTSWVYRHDIMHRVGSALGSATIDGKAGEGNMIAFDLAGLYSVTPVAPQPSGIVYPIDRKVQIENAAFQIAGLGAGAAIIQTVKFDLGVVRVERPDYSSSKGLKGLAITDRKPTINLQIEAESDLANHDWWDDIQAANDIDMQWQHGGTPGNILLTTVRDSQMTKGNYGENPAGLVTITGDFMCQNAVDDQDFELRFK